MIYLLLSISSRPIMIIPYGLFGCQKNHNTWSVVTKDYNMDRVRTLPPSIILILSNPEVYACFLVDSAHVD